MQIVVAPTPAGRAEGLSIARDYARAGADEIVLGLGDPIGPAALQALADEVAVPLRDEAPSWAVMSFWVFDSTDQRTRWSGSVAIESSLP